MPKKKQKKNQPEHKSRYAQLSAAFLRYLQLYLPGFKNEELEIQLALLDMILQAPSRYRQHAHYDGWATFTYQELERRFGEDKFREVNRRVRVFDVIEDWSKVLGMTKPYMLTDAVTDLRDKFLKGVLRRRNTDLLTEDGKAIRTLPRNALEAKNKSGQTREGWREVAVRTDVPINMHMLKMLIRRIEAKRYAIEYGFVQGELFSQEPDEKYLRELHAEALAILHQSKNTVAPGFVIHRYQQSESGRLYAKGINLQNAYRPVRQAAMTSFYDYDISNAHFAILDQMAQRFGYECSAIRHYLKHKKTIREELADKFGLHIGQAKQALIALVYGAAFSEEDTRAIPKIVGSVVVAKKMYQHPQFTAIKADVDGAKKAILAGWPVSRRTIKNACGLTVDIKDKNPLQQLAHLLQGIEATALEAAHRVAPDKIVLLQHDGFTTTEKLDHEAIETAMFEATGYRLEVGKPDPIICNLDDAFNEHPVKNQNEIPLEANACAGFAISVRS